MRNHAFSVSGLRGKIRNMITLGISLRWLFLIQILPALCSIETQSDMHRLVRRPSPPPQDRVGRQYFSPDVRDMYLVPALIPRSHLSAGNSGWPPSKMHSCPSCPRSRSQQQAPCCDPVADRRHDDLPKKKLKKYQSFVISSSSHLAPGPLSALPPPPTRAVCTYNTRPHSATYTRYHCSPPRQPSHCT